MRLVPVFPRQELRETSGHFLDGLLSGIERKTGWLMAEQAGLARHYRMQSLLGRSQWNEDGLRDAVRAYVIEALGDADGVLIVDETGFVKKGTASVGVARQYPGTVGRIENSQIGVFLAYASRFGQETEQGVARRKSRMRSASPSVITAVLNDDTQLFSKFQDDGDFRRWLTQTVFAMTYKKSAAEAEGVAAP